MNSYDVIIVGAGPAGIFAAYELSLKNKDLKVALIDKGLDSREMRFILCWCNNASGHTIYNQLKFILLLVVGVGNSR